MSWFIEDANGYVADFGTHQGVRELLAKNHPALQAFIRSGTANDSQRDQIVQQIEKDSSLDTLRVALAGASPPIRLTDGVEAD